MRCLGRLGCLAIVVALAIGAWFTRDMWMSKIRRTPRPEPGVATAQTWQALTVDGARRARVSLERLQARNGPAFASVAPGDLAAYIMQELSNTLPSSADSIQAAAIGDRILLRAVVKTSDLGPKGSLGPLSALLGDRERVQLGGILRVIRPGLGEFQVKEFKIGGFGLPQALIPRLIRQISRGDRPAELSPDGLALRTPDYVGDVRVSNGNITIYKAAPPK